MGGGVTRGQEKKVAGGGLLSRRKSKQKVLAGRVSHGRCYVRKERTRGWFPLTIAGLLDCRLPKFPGIWEVGKTRGCTHQWKSEDNYGEEEGEAVGDKRGASAGR